MLAAALATGLAASAWSAPRPYAEVSASSGPVRLTLRVLNRRKTSNEWLFYQLEVMNIGKAPILLTDEAFRSPVWIMQNSRYGSSTHLEVRIPSGLEPANAPPSHATHSDPVEIRYGKPPSRPAAGPLELAPGARALTRCVNKKIEKRLEWCALEFWLLYETGTSRIRGAYSEARRGKAAEILAEFPPSPEDVDVITPWITFHVSEDLATPDDAE